MDVDVVVNPRARRGSRAVASEIQWHLPDACILTAASQAEAGQFARSRDAGRSSLLVSAGGDGTAIALLNSLRNDALPPVNLAVLPLGTGNAWAHATGAPRWRAAVARLAGALRRRSPLPLRRFRLIEVGGKLSHFAGTGWDAEIIDDFHGQKTGFGVLPRAWRNGLPGYLRGVFTRTIPRHLFQPPVEVELYNTGADALTVDDAGRPVPLTGGGHGQLLYRGPANVCAAGTTSSWGFGFRAFPFADLVPGRFCMRIYGGSAAEATSRMAALWRGAHPVPKMHTWLLDRCRAVFSRPVALQVGGDRQGHADEVEYALAREQVDLVEWSNLS